MLFIAKSFYAFPWLLTFLASLTLILNCMHRLSSEPHLHVHLTISIINIKYFKDNLLSMMFPLKLEHLDLRVLAPFSFEKPQIVYSSFLFSG